MIGEASLPDCIIFMIIRKVYCKFPPCIPLRSLALIRSTVRFIIRLQSASGLKLRRKINPPIIRWQLTRCGGSTVQVWWRCIKCDAPALRKILEVKSLVDGIICLVASVLQQKPIHPSPSPLVHCVARQSIVVFEEVKRRLADLRALCLSVELCGRSDVSF